MTNGKMLIF